MEKISIKDKIEFGSKICRYIYIYIYMYHYVNYTIVLIYSNLKNITIFLFLILYY